MLNICYRNTPTEKYKWRKFGAKIRNNYDENANGINGSSRQYQKAFLSLVKDLDLGISLYKMNPPDPRFDQPETWENLNLSQDGETVVSTPCTN